MGHELYKAKHWKDLWPSMNLGKEPAGFHLKGHTELEEARVNGSYVPLYFLLSQQAAGWRSLNRQLQPERESFWHLCNEIVSCIFETHFHHSAPFPVLLWLWRGPRRQWVSCMLHAAYQQSQDFCQFKSKCTPGYEAAHLENCCMHFCVRILLHWNCPDPTHFFLTGCAKGKPYTSKGHKARFWLMSQWGLASACSPFWNRIGRILVFDLSILNHTWEHIHSAKSSWVH